jgi:hypothetical protein
MSLYCPFKSAGMSSFDGLPLGPWVGPPVGNIESNAWICSGVMPLCARYAARAERSWSIALALACWESRLFLAWPSSAAIRADCWRASSCCAAPTPW